MDTMTTTTTTNHERPGHQSKSSIDESLELEHSLAAEEGDEPLSPPASSILDPQVLADLIIQLRVQLGEMTRERDELVNELAASQTREAELTDALEQARDRARTAEGALETARRTHEGDEDAISMLRAKVEESRRALMRLQNEASSARRMSGQFQLGGPLALDLSSARAAPGSSKRASFTPLTGTFKRGSPPPSVASSPPPPPPATLLRNASSDGENDALAETQSLMVLPSESAAAPSTARARRFPGSTRDAIMNPLGVELDALRKELVEARHEAISLRAELRDSNESRLASEACVQALREFIANTAAADAVSPGGLGISLPPLPSDTGVNEVGDEKPKTGWGIKLWRKDAASTQSSSHQSTPSISSTMSRRKSDASESHPPVARSGFWASKSSSGTVSAAVSPSTANPPSSKKFGFLWGAPSATPSKEAEPSANGVPGLSPPSSSSDHPSEPTSPKDDKAPGPDLVVQYDETLTDNEADHEADKTLTHEKSPLDPTPPTPRNEGPIGVAA